MRALGLPVVMAAAVVALSGCVPFACTTIGHSSSVEVAVADAAVVALECVEGCENGVQELGATGPTWRFDAPARPATITVAGYDAAGAEVLREEVRLTWIVADPWNPCGSSASADPVTIPE